MMEQLKYLEENCLDEFEEDDEIFDDFFTDNEINDILGSIDEQERKIFENIQEFDDPEINFNYINSIENIDNEEKNNYNWEAKDITNIDE